jgi:hypothetical protein
VIRNKQPKTEALYVELSCNEPVGAGQVVALTAFLAAVFLAAGSSGLLAESLRKTLTLISLIVAITSLHPKIPKKTSSRILILFAICLFIYLITSPSIMLNILAVSLVPTVAGIVSDGKQKIICKLLAFAFVIFGIYRLAYISIPAAWMISDYAGKFLGSIGAVITQKPLITGASYAGLDCIVLMSILWTLYLALTPKPRKTRALYGFAGILGGHICYLIILSFAPDILALVAKPAADAGWSWAGLFYKAIPWNLPALACGIQLIAGACILRWSVISTDNVAKETVRLKYPLTAAIVILAIALPVTSVLFPKQLTLQGKKIVFYEKGFLNWLKPEHGQYGRLASGMYGMMPDYIESLGASPLISKELSEQDISGADALVLLFPDEPWTQGQLQRIWDFVKKGGSLLVMGEHTTVDSNGCNRFNEVLEPTAIRVVFDCATFAVGGWLQSYDAIAHPATAGIPDDRNQFGVVIGASLSISSPATPLLVGKYGWSDIGDRGSGQAMMGNSTYDSGEKLGDVILAAEQPLGKGRVIAFGDTSSFTNGINVSSYIFTSRLFGYLTDNTNAHTFSRQAVGIFICLMLAGILLHKPAFRYVTITILFLSISMVYCDAATRKSGLIFPDGRYKSPNNVAYVDSSHLEAYSGESWRADGVGGLILTLMRNGYLPFTLTEITAERLENAGLFISIAPSREFSAKERTIIKDYVLKGGNVIIMAGLDEAGPVSSLLSLFGFTIGPAVQSDPEPDAMGFFKSPYLSRENRQVYVRFYAGWPITCNDPQARIIAYGKNNLPIIIMRSVGSGKVIVIGDTCFAMNKNLEWESGETFEGKRENADFWRWFLTQIPPPEIKQELWIPPDLLSDPNSVKADPNTGTAAVKGLN